MKKLMLGLFIAFGISACSLNNEDMNVDCGLNEELVFTGFPLPCNYTVKTPPNNASALVINSQERMDAFFTKHENTCSVTADPTIDFTKNFVIGIFSGLKPTNGYSIKVTTIVENKCQIIINFYEKAPTAGETLTQGPTYPADYIIIPKTTKQILYNKTNESADAIVMGQYNTTCSSTDCQKFQQLNDFNILNFKNVVAGKFNFDEYQSVATIKKSEYTTFLKTVPTEILNLKGQSKTYGTPTTDQGAVYFELRQGALVTKVYIDNNDTADQGTEIKLFKKAIKDKISGLSSN